MTHYQKTITLMVLRQYKKRAVDAIERRLAAGWSETDPPCKYWMEELKETNGAIDEVQRLQAWDGEFPK